MSKKIEITELELINFKGTQKLKIPFNQVTNIYGTNESGKSTIFDAFLWVLFGKDSHGKADFSIKNTKFPELNRSNHEVILKALIDGEETVFKKIYKEKWVTKKGNEFPEFSGNETECLINGLPLGVTEYNKRISEILIDKIFKLITDPLAFNGLDWKERRTILSEMAPVTDLDVAAGNEAFLKLLDEAKKHRSLEEYRKVIAASITQSKKDLKEIGPRRDENIRNKPKALDFDTIEADIATKKNRLAEVTGEINNKSLAYNGIVHKRGQESIKIGDLKNEIKSIENTERSKITAVVVDPQIANLNRDIQNKNGDLNSQKATLKTIEDQKSTLENEIANIKTKLDAKAQEWTNENSKVFEFDETALKCGECGTPYAADQIEAKKTEASTNFRNKKMNAITAINTAGDALKKEKENKVNELNLLTPRIETQKETITTLSNELADLQKKSENVPAPATEKTPEEIQTALELVLNANQTWIDKKSELKTLEENLTVIPTVDNQALIDEQSQLNIDIQGLNTDFAAKAQIEAADRRIADLNNQEKTLSQEIANVEKIYFQIETFNKAKIDKMEEAINHRFQIVRFKMFNNLVNGGTEETCITMIDGVPFPDLNTASQINAGIDIINALTEFYGCSAPIFIDNRESVVNILPSKSQIVNLFVSAEDKELRIG